MGKYENYLLSFPTLSYLEKSKYGKPIQKDTKEWFQIYEPFGFYEFERKMELNTSFKMKWGNKE